MWRRVVLVWTDEQVARSQILLPWRWRRYDPPKRRFKSVFMCLSNSPSWRIERMKTISSANSSPWSFAKLSGHAAIDLNLRYPFDRRLMGFSESGNENKHARNRNSIIQPFESYDFTHRVLQLVLKHSYVIGVFFETSPPTLNISVICAVSLRVSLFSLSFHALYFSMRPIYFSFLCVQFDYLFIFYLSLLLYLLWHEDHHVPEFIDLASLWLDHSSCWCVGFSYLGAGGGGGGAITFHRVKIFLVFSIVTNGDVLWITKCH
jgi:hypothetical protein